MCAYTPDDLIKLIKSGSRTPPERLAAGNALARMGDPRFDPQRWCLPRTNALAFGPEHPDVLGFVNIPAGIFRMGTLRGDPSSFDNEYDQHEVQVPEFYLARTPVTIAQFRAFMPEARMILDGHPNLSSPEGHPVEKVSWRDALQYCGWLTQKLRELARQIESQRSNLSDDEKLFWQRVGNEGWEVVLPSEAEWEKAARGPVVDGQAPRNYPWGDIFDPNCANVLETDLHTTSPVGSFAAGRSPYDILDMSGNVWEWTRSLFRPYPYDPYDGREDLGTPGNRTLRGGPYYQRRRFCGCAARFSGATDKDEGGFRVALVPGLLPSGARRSSTTIYMQSYLRRG